MVMPRRLQLHLTDKRMRSNRGMCGGMPVLPIATRN